MIPPGYSTYVIYSCINMSYAPRQSRAQSQTSQSCSRPAAAVSAFTRRRLPYGAGQRSLAAPGLSLSATSSASEAAACGQRYQSRFHREAFSQIGEASSDSSPGGRLVLERVREPGVSGATNAETRAWLSGAPSAANFSSNIALITVNRERPRNEWIEVSVPALVDESVFALAQEQLQKNQHFSPRRTKRPCLLQGLLVCQQCGYAMYGTSGGKPQHRLHYYRCQGADGYRWPQGTRCTNRPVRQDYLDQIIWTQIIALLENEKLIQSEIDRRRDAAGQTDPCERRKEILRSEQARLRNQMERLITAYQDGLLTLEQLRERMPHLKQQSQAVNSELQVLEMAKLDQSRYLKLAQSLGGFRNKLRARAETLDVKERQQILRLLVKEILVGFDTLTICHSIPIPSGDGSPPNISGSTSSPQSDYPLRPRSVRTGACQAREAGPAKR